jgi:hypothetical protein
VWLRSITAQTNDRVGRHGTVPPSQGPEQLHAAFNSLSRARSKPRVWGPEGSESEEKFRFFCYLLTFEFKLNNNARAGGVARFCSFN